MIVYDVPCIESRTTLTQFTNNFRKTTAFFYNIFKHFNDYNYPKNSNLYNEFEM